MTTPDAPTYAGLVPMLPVSDVARSIAFYEQLGFTVGDTHGDDDVAPDWAWLHCGQAHLMLNHAAHPLEVTHRSVSFWIYTKDVVAAHAALAARGLDVGEIDHPFYNAGGEFHVHDPDGYALFIAHLE